MKQSPLVSVIVTNYNYAEYVGRCIESAINQTYKPIEIIVINDGSTDNSDKVIKKYTNKYPEIRYINQKNQGANATRNIGIKLAKGDFIFLLDADNWLNPDHIEKLFKKAKDTGADVVYTDLQHFGDDENKHIMPEFDINYLKISNFVDTASLIRKKAIGKNKFDIWLNRRFLQDYDFFLGLALKGLKFIKCGEATLNYRIHSKQRGNKSDRISSVEKSIENYEYIIKKYKKLYPDSFDSLTDFGNNLIKNNYILQKNVLELRQNITDLELQNNELQKRVLAAEQSFIWKLSKPLRKAKSIMKRYI